MSLLLCSVKIQTRLIIINILFIVVVAAIFGIFLAYTKMNDQLNELVVRSDLVKNDLYKTHVRLHQSLNGDDLAKSYNAFLDAYEDLEEQINSVIGSPLFTQAVASIPYTDKYVASLKDSLERNEKKIKEIDGAVEKLLEKSPNMPGLLEAARDSAAEQTNAAGRNETAGQTEDGGENGSEVTGASEKKIEDTVQLIRFFSASFGESFTFTVNQITSNIRKGVAQRQDTLLLYSGVIALVLVGAVLAFSTLMIIRLNRQMQRMHQNMSVIAEGNFTLRLDESGKNELSDLSRDINAFVDEFVQVIDEVKQLAGRNAHLKSEVAKATNESASAINEMNENISDISDLVSKLVDHLVTSSEAIESITSHITNLSDRIEGQSSSVTQSSSSIEEMSASIENVAKISDQRHQAAESLVEVTQETGEKMDETNELINQNAGDVRQILDIVGIINNVASQTNLLSMNAAIEAAHAGEAGRGFAVVAEEIRGLAENTNENSKKIQTTINTIADRIQKVHDASAESRKAFEQIENETQNSSNAMGEVSSSMSELSQGSREITEAMTDLSQTTQTIQESADEMKRNSANAHESLEEIRSIGDKVNEEISEINEDMNEINDSMGRINNLNEENKGAIENLYKIIHKFKTQEENATAHETDRETDHETELEEV